jgi:hypothetical protein
MAQLTLRPRHPDSGTPPGSRLRRGTSAWDATGVPRTRSNRRRLALLCNKSQLPRPIQPLDAGLLAHRGAPVCHRRGEHELDGKATGRVSARLARAVAGETSRQIVCPAGVQRPVIAAEDVYPSIGHSDQIRRLRADACPSRTARPARSRPDSTAVRWRRPARRHQPSPTPAAARALRAWRALSADARRARTDPR